MSFAKKYSMSVNSSNLIDDVFHDAVMPLGASGLASVDTTGIGSLLLRAKVADGSPGKIFESGCRNLGPILSLWIPMVREKGIARKWMNPHTAWDILAAETLYRRVAESSLAYWLDKKCLPCGGTGVDHDRRTCIHCKGSGIAKLLMGRFEKEITLDLVSELEDIMQSHARRSSYIFRDEISLDSKISD
jgi:hypothetical protein